MLQQVKKRQIDAIERFAIKATQSIGSTNSILVHTALFMMSFMMYFIGFDLNNILLVLTTIVSLEAIYLSIFIQMSVNRQARKLHAVSKDIEEIQEDVEEIQEDVEEIQEDVDEIGKDVEEIQEDVDEIQKDVDEIQEDVDEISEDIEDHTEEEKTNDEKMLSQIEKTLGLLITEIADLKKQHSELINKKKK
ncbi:MAG: hypothetical protein NTX85_02085 [Candidatus Nomurabacteria bacterium]|nr:hypothetical protein [Candidatus Nomurabacteria bacterium]